MNVVYFVQMDGDGPIKIGTTTQLSKRLSALQTSTPRRLDLMGYMPGDRHSERAWHEKYAAQNVGMEWFSPSPELISDIKESIRGFSEPDEHDAESQPDLHCQLVHGWVIKAREIVADEDEISKALALQSVATRAGLPLGTLENIIRRRKVSVTVTEFEAVKAAYEGILLERLSALEVQAAELKASLRKPPNEILEAETLLARAKALLGK